jgi:hypothetical protein
VSLPADEICDAELSKTLIPDDNEDMFGRIFDDVQLPELPELTK